MTMLRPSDLLNAGRLFQSRELDELFEALTEDDDGPDGGSIKRANRSATRRLRGDRI